MPNLTPWRILFVSYMVLILAGTHWPQLAMGNEAHPPPDKLIHFLAFATAPVLLMLTGWLPLLWVLVFSFIFAVVDEITQHYFALGRVYNPLDMIASVLGVFIAAMWLYAVQPIGHDPRGLCTHRTIYQLNRLCWQPVFWKRFIPITFFGFLATSILVWLILWFGFSISDMEIALLCGMLYASWAGYWRVTRFVSETPTLHCCYKCGTSCDSVLFNEHGHGRCPTCHCTLHAAQWDHPKLPDGILSRALPRALVIAAIYTLCIVLLASTLAWTFALCFEWYFDRSFPWSRVFIALDLVFIITVCLLFAGLALRLTRAKIAHRLSVEQAHSCITCGHCLDQAITQKGKGRCDACGAVFLVLQTPSNNHAVVS